MRDEKLIYMKNILLHARLFVAHWAEKNGGISMRDSASVKLDYDEAVSAWNMANIEQIILKKATKIKPLTYASIDLAIEETLPKHATLKRRLFGDTFKYVGTGMAEYESLEPLGAWVYAVTGTYDKNSLYMMAHWLWMVKRCAIDKKVIFHCVPILIGKQGSGKSTAVQMLIEPYKPVSLNLKVHQAVDERSYPLFERNLIGFFDEMAGADKVDIATFKGNVTDDVLSYRPMRTNEQVVLHNRCSFLGTSNHEIFEVIKDTTGLRRFWPIHSQEKIDRELINSINYEELWRGIDENRERGYYELVEQEVIEIQKESAMQDEVYRFLDTYNVLVDGEITIIDGNQLFQAYRLNCANTGYKFPVSDQTFYKKLKIYFKWEQRRVENGSRRWFFEINKKHAISGIERLQ